MTTAARTLSVRLNDRPRAVPEGAALLSLMEELGLSSRPGVAVAVNATVVPRTAWAARALAEGDEVLVIQASQGG